MTILHRGAEAVVVRKGDSVVKERRKKSYRLPELDERLRSSRTNREASVLERLHAAGVRVPAVRERSAYTVTLEFIDGPSLASSCDAGMMDAVGQEVAAMHAEHVAHGDLTTSNIIWSDGPVLIDFGLAKVSRKVEDKAVDLHVLRSSLAAKHTSIYTEAWDAFVRGYAVYEEADAVLERLIKVQQRGRYK